MAVAEPKSEMKKKGCTQQRQQNNPQPKHGKNIFDSSSTPRNKNKTKRKKKKEKE